MAYSVMDFCVFLLLLIVGDHRVLASENDDTTFDINYEITYGNDHVTFMDQRKEIQLSMDKYSGSGFGSYLNYSSGFFYMRMKIPGNNNTAGVVTCFYLSSKTNQHDELDFEYLGNIEGQKLTLQTNVFVNGVGKREQRINLWFDPTSDFHDYQILWNPHQIVFFVDNTPIRVYKNYTNLGVPYPTKPMRIEASLWNGDWATYGHKINWTYAPFRAQYEGFDVSGCSTNNSYGECYQSKYWWNTRKYWELNSTQQNAYENVRKNYMKYDYCTDRVKYPFGPPRECNIQKILRL